MDRWTGFMSAYPMSERGLAASAESCARHLVEWCSMFGLPTRIVSDRGSQFVSKLWTATVATLGVDHQLTTAYNPKANGMIERMHRTLKNSLRSRLNGRQDWVDHLPWALLAIRNLTNEDTGFSPA